MLDDVMTCISIWVAALASLTVYSMAFERAHCAKCMHKSIQNVVVVHEAFFLSMSIIPFGLRMCVDTVLSKIYNVLRFKNLSVVERLATRWDGSS